MPVGPQSASDLAWFKSSYSGGNATECLEAAIVPSGVLIRDSKRPTPEHVTVSALSWAEFLASVNLPPRPVESEVT
jgi:hypothetical protein